MLTKLLKKKTTGLILILVAVCIIITVTNPVFVRPDNILTVLTTNEVLGICTLGMLFVILTGGIDVSIAYIVTGVTVIIGEFSANFGGNLPLLILIACVSGALLGLINGALIAKLKIPAIVATLGTMSLYNGLVLLVTNGKYIRGLPDYIAGLGQQYLFKVPMASGGFWGVPVSFFIWIFAIALTWFVLKYTLMGRGLYALGGNEESARRIGYNPDKVMMFAYLYEGIMCGLAAIVHVGINRQVDPLAFKGFEMDVIAAAVIGGVSMSGGKGTVLGATIGVLFMGIIKNGMVLMYIPTFYQTIVIGLVIVVAVTLDVIQKNAKESKIIKVDIKDL